MHVSYDFTHRLEPTQLKIARQEYHKELSQQDLVLPLEEFRLRQQDLVLPKQQLTLVSHLQF